MSHLSNILQQPNTALRHVLSSLTGYPQTEYRRVTSPLLPHELTRVFCITCEFPIRWVRRILSTYLEEFSTPAAPPAVGISIGLPFGPSGFASGMPQLCLQSNYIRPHIPSRNPLCCSVSWVSEISRSISWDLGNVYFVAGAQKQALGSRNGIASSPKGLTTSIPHLNMTCFGKGFQVEDVPRSASSQKFSSRLVQPMSFATKSGVFHRWWCSAGQPRVCAAQPFLGHCLDLIPGQALALCPRSKVELRRRIALHAHPNGPRRPITMPVGFVKPRASDMSSFGFL